MKGFLGLGANLGDRAAYLAAAVTELESRGVAVLKTSSIYETRPVEVNDAQPDYLNQVVAIEWSGSAQALLAICQQVEHDLGRQRPYHHAPRTIDIDILMLGQERLASAELTLPHPRLEERAFVLVPLAELEPELELSSGRKIADLKVGREDDEYLRLWKK
ncbi:MAG: Bifunctional folate synthesis protein [Deltaproteobacteria bacterium ADurb.Bin510]|nr:MAG: Bifunctional folate synthesis protein [Deltaproteobacteria bacterium ADurb.Bin510]